jgi:phosphoribosyl 1,2-cyclic phosphodiesterase
MSDKEKSGLAFWGVRGTCPVSGENFNKYGGHTPCSCLTAPEGDILIIDAGTGIKRLGVWLMNQKKTRPSILHIFLTHFHLDHIMGIPFFGPLYSPDVHLIFYSDLIPEETENYLNGYMGGRYFPVSFKQTQSKKEFQRVPKGGLEVGGALISSCPLNHPQGSIAYKIQNGKDTFVLATDTEHPLHGIDRKLADFAAGSDMLVYDATFTPAEYQEGRIGWGHSTWLEGTKLAKKAGVKELCLSHLNPDHQDSQIDDMVSLACEEFLSTCAALEIKG